MPGGKGCGFTLLLPAGVAWYAMAPGGSGWGFTATFSTPPFLPPGGKGCGFNSTGLPGGNGCGFSSTLIPGGKGCGFNALAPRAGEPVPAEARMAVKKRHTNANAVSFFTVSFVRVQPSLAKEPRSRKRFKGFDGKKDLTGR